MTQRNRKKRPTPSRTAPLRTFVKVDHLGGGGAAAMTSDERLNTGSIDAVIGNAVNLGYRVITEQLQQGRLAAERVREGTFTSGEMEEQVKVLVDRLMQVTKDATVAWFDIVSALTRASAPAQVRPRVGVGITVQVVSARPAQVTLDLTPASPRFVPVVHALHSGTSGQPPLTDVKFKLAPDGASGLLVVTLPEDCPSGIYTGAIVDSATRAPGGTLRVYVPPKG
jgi:hypothetical protein